jgi:hypothetical protein
VPSPGVGERERDRERERMKIGTVLPVEEAKKKMPGKKIRAPGIREQRRRGNGFLQGLMRKIRELQGPICKTKFPINLNPNEEIPKTKVGEFFKLYNIALGLKSKNSKFASLHVKF